MHKHESKRLGEMIRFARLQRKWTQQELADAVKVTRQAVNSWEQGRTWPQSVQVARLKETLDIDVPFDPEPMPKTPVIPASYGPGVRYALANFSRLIADMHEEVAEAERHAALAEQDAAAVARAKAAIPPAGASSPRASGTAARRQRRG